MPTQNTILSYLDDSSYETRDYRDQQEELLSPKAQLESNSVSQDGTSQEKITFEKQFNIWTLRFTFSTLFIKEYEVCMQKMFEDIGSKKQIKYCLVFREYSKKGVLHYHIRIVTTYKTPAMLRDYIKSFFPSSAKGNKFFSTHKVWVDGILFDQSLCHSTNYIAKEGHIVFSFGYSTKEIKSLILESRKYNDRLKMPMHEKIIQLYDIRDPDQIAQAVIDHYCSIEKIPPKMHVVSEIIRKILFKISPAYRKLYLQKLQSLVYEYSCVQ